MKYPILTLSLFFCMNVSAQISHDFSIYTEDGNKFTLYANGQQYNEEPLSRVEILNTNHDYLRDVKIVFEDTSIPNVNKKFLQIGNITSPEDQLPVVCLYRIVNKKGAYKIKFGSRSGKKIQTDDTIININERKEKSKDIKIKSGGIEVDIDR